MAIHDSDKMLETLTKKVDQIIDLLQDLIVLQAASLNASNGEIRKALQLNMNRVSKISRLAKQSQSP